MEQVRRGWQLKLSQNDLFLLIEKALIENDAHDVATVGLHIQEGIRLLQKMGFNTDWRTPL